MLPRFPTSFDKLERLKNSLEFFEIFKHESHNAVDKSSAEGILFL